MGRETGHTKFTNTKTTMASGRITSGWVSCSFMSRHLTVPDQWQQSNQAYPPLLCPSVCETIVQISSDVPSFYTVDHRSPLPSLLTFSRLAWSKGAVGLLPSTLSLASSLFSCACSAEGAASILPPSGAPTWAWDWVSGSGDWRPAFGADIVRGLIVGRSDGLRDKLNQ